MRGERLGHLIAAAAALVVVASCAPAEPDPAAPGAEELAGGPSEAEAGGSPPTGIADLDPPPSLAKFADRPPLDLTPAPDAAPGAETAFTRSVAARYRGAFTGHDIAQDLEDQGWACLRLPPVEARPDYSLYECTLAPPSGDDPCFDVYTITLRRDPAQSGEMAQALAAFARRCMGAKAEPG